MEARPLMRGSSSQAAVQFFQKSARDEKFTETIHNVMCPFLTVRQFIFVISIVQCGVYIASVAYKGISNNGLLAPQSEALFDFGQKYPYYMRYQYQVWRFIMPIFLHADFVHLTSNIFSQFVFGSYLESTIGFFNFTILYFLSGIGGILFSSLASDATSVGASTAIFGLMGSFAAYLIVNWKNLERQPQQKYTIAIFLIIGLLMNLTQAQSNSKIDSIGHLGGFLTGLILSLFLGQTLPTTDRSIMKYQKAMKTFGLIGSIIYFGAGFVCFYTLRQPKM
eukprot:403331557